MCPSMFFLDTKPRPRYERQLEEVKHLVLHDTKLKEDRLNEILKILYEYRIID